MQDLGAALNQSGLVAAQTGLSIEETTGGLAAFASAGLTGSDAGTSFKTMLQRLNPQSAEAAALMDDLGLSAYDSQGNFVGLSEYAGQLQGALSGMSEEQRNATMQTLFGSDAVRAAAVLYEQGAGGIEQWEAAVNDAGYAAETAALKQDNLAGDLEKLGGAIETAFLRAGSGPNDFLRSLVQGAEAVVDAIGRIPGPVLTTVTALVGITGAATLAVGAGMKVVGMASEMHGAFQTLSAKLTDADGKLTRTGAAMAGVGKAAGIAAIAVGGLQVAINALGEDDLSTTFDNGRDALGQFSTEATSSVQMVNDAFANADWANSNGGTWSKMMDGTASGINNLGDAVNYLNTTGGMRDFTESVNGMVGNSTALDSARADIAAVDEAMAELVGSGNLSQASSMFQEFAGQITAGGGTVADAAAAFPELISAVQDYGESMGVNLSTQEATDALMGEMPQKLTDAAGGADAAAEGMTGLAGASEDTAASLSEVVDTLSQLGLLAVDSREAIASYQDAVSKLAETVAAGGVALNQMGTDFDLTTEAGRNASNAMGDVAAQGWDAAEGILALGGSASEAQASLQGTYDTLVTSATQMGLGADAADNLARTLLGIPPEVSIETWMSDTAKALAGETTEAVNGIPGSKQVNVNATDNGTVGSVQSAVSGLQGKTISAIVTDRGTVPLTQGQINAIYGKTTKVTVTDQGTVFHTQGKINGVTDGDATIIVGENGTATVQNGINSVQGKTVYIDVIKRYSSIGSHVSNSNDSVGVMRRAAGGRAPGLAGIPAAATGMRLPTTGPGTDRVDGFLGVTETGAPRVRVDAGEWITNRRSSDKYDTVLGMINADHPSVQHLAAYAAGGRAEYAASSAPGVVSVSAAQAPPQIDYNQLAAAMARVQIVSPVSIGRRDAARVVQVGRENLRGR